MSIRLLLALVLAGAAALAAPPLPVAWTTYSGKDLAADIPDLQAHGIGLVSTRVGSAGEARERLALARKTGMRFHIGFGDITEQIGLVREAGLEPVPALLIGGCYNGKAIDRHLFSFTPGPHAVLIEPPVYNQRYAYTRTDKDTQAEEKLGHYIPEMGAPVKAEVVVPLAPFDGRQHLAIRPATIAVAPADARPAVDSVAPDMPPSKEIAGRRLYRISFDLTGLEGARLDQVGLAVYWAYGGSRQFFTFGRGNVSAWAETTREALRVHVRRTIAPWREANDGAFPVDAVPLARYGDECFYVTSHLNGPSTSYPLWDFSAPTVAAFRAHAGEVEYPRTWGYPEIYGEAAYGWWMYTLHEGCANLAQVIRDEVAREAPGLRVFRNTTRMWVFDQINDHDGSGQDLLAQHLDIVHLDPYPVQVVGFGDMLTRDLAYCAGLARRHRKPLVPWLQAHVYGDIMKHPEPADIDRMADECRAQGVDAVMWLGYGGGNTFPARNPESWARAGAFHADLAAGLPPKPRPTVAVLRGYGPRAACGLQEADTIRNPADWLLQQWLEVWAVRHRQPYDVWEVPPVLDDDARAKLAAALAAYPTVISTVPWPDAWVIGAGTAGTTVQRADAPRVQEAFEVEMRGRGLLPAAR